MIMLLAMSYSTVAEAPELLSRLKGAPLYNSVPNNAQGVQSQG